jgi:hypothetical protein
MADATMREIVEAHLAGRELRSILGRNGLRMTAPAFYQRMARLEEEGAVAGRYEPKVVDGVEIKERWYHLGGR